MTKFEQIGVERQHECDSKREALRCFRHSCKVCCCRGIALSCDKCSIAYVHNETIAFFDDTKSTNFKRATEYAVNRQGFDFEIEAIDVR